MRLGLKPKRFNFELGNGLELAGNMFPIDKDQHSKKSEYFFVVPAVTENRFWLTVYGYRHFFRAMVLNVSLFPISIP